MEKARKHTNQERVQMDLKNLEDYSYIFWPVGTGDSTTLKLGDDFFIQIDFRHTKKSEDDDEDSYPVDEEIKELLPTKDGRPYLDVFILTHPDEDHIQGFESFYEDVTIGEIWFSPRVFRPQEDLCGDAEYFEEVVLERIEELNDGHEEDTLVRVIGYDDILKESPYSEIDEEYKSYPGNTISTFNKTSYDDVEFFIHGPFRDYDKLKNKNNSSLAFQINIGCSSSSHESLFFGDMEDDQFQKVYDLSEKNDNEEKVQWDLLLAPHHCSKSSLYDTEGDNDNVNEELVEHLKNYVKNDAYIISSSEDDFTNKSGSNPPHSKARRQYKKIIEAKHFLCTHSNTDSDGNVVPITVSVCEQDKVNLTESYSGFISEESGKTNPPPTTSNEFGLRYE